MTTLPRPRALVESTYRGLIEDARALGVLAYCDGDLPAPPRFPSPCRRARRQAWLSGWHQAEADEAEALEAEAQEWAGAAAWDDFCRSRSFAGVPHDDALAVA